WARGCSRTSSSATPTSAPTAEPRRRRQGSLPMTSMTSPRLLRAADTLVKESFAVAAGESVLITGDYLTEPRLLDAVAGSVARAGAKPLVAIAPTLPYQGGLSDPYVGDSLKAAVVASDVWLDFCFPYHAGSGAHAAAMAG